MIQAVVMLPAWHLRSLTGTAGRRIHKNQCMRHPRVLYADGPIICNLPLSSNISDNSLPAVARALAPCGSAHLARKCGLGSTNPITKPSGVRH
jgi:hypothetical protein